MQLLNKIVLVGLLAVSLQGCQLGEDDEVSTEADMIIIDLEGYEKDITNDGFYELVLTEKSKYADFIAKGDISKIKIYGNQNAIRIDTDTNIEKLSIFGDGNVLTVNVGVELTIDELTVTGNSNSVDVFRIITPSIAGELNRVCESNTSAIVCL